MIRRSFWLALSTVVFVGCLAPTDYGTPCQLIKKNPNDPNGHGIPIKEGEIAAAQDFVSFGTTECEDRVCVRDSAFQRPPGATDDTPAQGYCSTQICSPESTTSCRSFSAADDKNPAKRLTCRPLLLDEATLAAICAADAAACAQLGDSKKPYFCARGAVTADGGS